jgi:broad specificity phosphatase PhoE
MSASTVYLVRHGQTALNAAGALRGLIDAPLDDVGVMQAARLGDLFAGVNLTVVVCSPLRRARDTAAAVATTTGAPLRTDPRLADRDYGPWAGRSRVEVEQRYGSLGQAPGVEPAAAFAARVLAAFDDVASATPGPVAVVAHDAVNRTLLAERASGLPDPLGQRTGCWNRLDAAPGDGWRAAVVDAVAGDGHRP